MRVDSSGVPVVHILPCMQGPDTRNRDFGVERDLMSIQTESMHVPARPCILIVDDDAAFRELYRSALRFEGFQVLTASDGVEALRLIEGCTPALVILDINMPCLDGWSVLQELRAHSETKAVPVIVVTGADVSRAAERVVTVLRKPVTPEEIMPVIERQLYTV